MRILLALMCGFSSLSANAADPPARFRAGAATVDVSPTTFPVLVNGGFLEAKATKVVDPLFARALVLDDGATKLAIVVVDSCMMSRELLDKAKETAAQATGIPTNRMLISATHTHSAPAAMGALGCRADTTYVASLPARIAESIVAAVKSLQPARVGWASVDDADDTHNRRWIRRPDKPVVDPFGRPSARAHMHPGYQNPDAIGPSGPVDPELFVLAVQTPDGKPIALLANYSMHYFGAGPISSDYFGRFDQKIGSLIGVKEDDHAFVGIMSQGTSGDQHWMDYGAPQKKRTLDEYASSVARAAATAYAKIAYHDHVSLAMAETTLKLKRRVPDAERLAWALKIVAEMGDRVPKTLPEVYAKEAIYLHDEPERELKLQAIRIGELGIAAIPNEVYALTGLKIKHFSPLASTFTIELANGSEGYIPPFEQHKLGGYTTWPARTAALEEWAEWKIVQGVGELLSTVSGPRERTNEEVVIPYVVAVLKSQPWAFWRLEEILTWLPLWDETGRSHSAAVSGDVARYLDGPEVPGSVQGRPINHAVQLVNGRIATVGFPRAQQESYVLAFWNGLPANVRDVTGNVLQRPFGTGTVGIGGTAGSQGKLFVTTGDPARTLSGRTEIGLKRWYHLAVVRDDRQVKVYLDGQPEIAGALADSRADADGMVIGGMSSDPDANFQGKVDEIAVYDRALTEKEIATLYSAFRVAK